MAVASPTPTSALEALRETSHVIPKRNFLEEESESRKAYQGVQAVALALGVEVTVTTTVERAAVDVAETDDEAATVVVVTG